ncbi:related to tol protein [Fusarium mangiferae]|uniref:Related to tol protein n=1 Tax=Fusarium mangiferae TaxID=192010 RepID=A0A1L7U080_FUSMA|nr:uncharacterized protein FMAN_14686 [Fusarium mangiferae]CVL04220.1 related to tol protein [Fusarium mangiferae]
MTSSLELPTWYHRVSQAVNKRNGIILWDFDEDISDLDETSPDETIMYNGPHAAEYHHLREKREERKRELFQRKETIQKRKEDAREEEENKVEEARAAYESLEISVSRNQSTQLGPIDSQFDLYCMDYFDCFYDHSPHGYQRRYIRFEYENRDEAHSGNLTGRFWLNPKVDFELVPFKAPECSSLEHNEIYTTDGRFSVILQFIDKDHLILRASRDLVFWGNPQDSRGPEMFIFMGVRNDWGKQLQSFARMLHPAQLLSRRKGQKHNLQSLENMSTPISSSSALTPPTKFLSVQDGTLCEFCRDDELIQPISTRALSELTESSRSCGLCAMWLGALEHSRQNLRIRSQDAVLRQHPLEQDVDDVTLVFLSSPKRPQIVWPDIGHVWAALDTIDINDAKDINIKPLPRSDQAETTWKSVRKWLDRCEKYHTDCKLMKTSTWKPTRLLYVCNTTAALQVRLVEGQDISDDVEYLTLSHCPGAVNTLQLTRSNIEAFKSSIPVDKLSRVFTDACITTKRLSHEYLWIGALCVVQDDPVDWQNEVGGMASIYGNSWLNLSADGDAAGHGLFCPSDKRAARPWYPVYLHREWGDGFPSNYCISEYHNWWERISDSELNRGAWALQERVLAPRVLHLGLEQVAFQCCSDAVCERLPCGDPTMRHDTAVLTSLKRFVLNARNGNLSYLTPEDVFRNWNQVVRAYSQGQPTVATDKLVALSGLIDVLYPVFQHMVESVDQVEDGREKYDTQDRVDSSCPRSPGLFLAGLWRPYVERQLVWRAMSRKYLFEYDGNTPSAPGKRSDDYIAPTWSWCSIKDAIIEPQEVRSVDIYFTKVIDTSILPLNEAIPSRGLRYCTSTGSSLRLRCSYLPIVESGPVSGMKLVDFGAAPSEGGRGDELIEIQSKNYWDVKFDQEALNCNSAIAVPVFANMAYFNNPVHCLVLDERQGENGNQWYIRVGAFVITHPEDVQRFWKAIDDFDERMPEGCERHDGLYRFKELERGKPTYVKMVEVLQRVVEIR